MTLRLLMTCFLFLLFSGSTFAADYIKKNLPSNEPNIFEQADTEAAKMLENANPKELEDYQKTVSESVVFLDYLSRCLKAIKLQEHGKSSTYTLPPSSDFKLQYPLTLKTEYTTETDTANLTIFLISKETATSPWKLYDGWTQKEFDEKKIKISLPSAELQKKANEALPRLMKETDNCKCD